MRSTVERHRLPFVLNEELRYKLLRLLAEEPQISQRDLACRLGISVGKANYCLSALVEKGLVKINNFRKANNKLVYVYLLTPSGIEAKTQITVSFLRLRLVCRLYQAAPRKACNGESRQSGFQVFFAHHSR